MQKLLLVDDEQNVLNALKRELKGFYEIEAYSDPLVALEHSRGNNFDLVIADFRMPELNGLEFLQRFKQLQPTTCCLLLSGEADIHALIRTINETHIYRFIAKPWDKTELLNNIRQALAYREMVLSRRAQTAQAATVRADGPFRVVLADGDERLLALISRSLMDENEPDSVYEAMQQEIRPAGETEKFRCVVVGFRTGRDALAHAARQPCDLVIAAQNLPDMSGIELLSQMRQVLPDTARILISNDPDRSMLSQAVNEAGVQSLLELHWANYEMRVDARRQAWNLHQLKTAAIQALAYRDLLLGGAGPAEAGPA